MFQAAGEQKRVHVLILLMPVVWPGAWIFEAEKIGKIMPVDDVLRDRDDEDLRVDNRSPICAVPLNVIQLLIHGDRWQRQQ